MATMVRDQLGIDEIVVHEDDLEEALEDRQESKVRLGDERRAYAEANERANAEIAKLELPADGRAVRCGRFRITRSSVSARTVQFETKPTTRVRITVLGEDDDA